MNLWYMVKKLLFKNNIRQDINLIIFCCQRKMILEVFITLVLIGLTHFYITRVYRVKKLIQRYKNAFQVAGFKVKVYPFCVFTATQMQNLLLGSRKFDDAYYYLKEAKDVDLCIGSAFGNPCLTILNPHLLKQYYSAPFSDYRKLPPAVQNLKRLMGRGLGLSQGEDWKKKRRIISSVFHFDFVRSIIPRMIEKCTQVFDAIEESKEKDIDFGEISKQVFCSMIIESFFGKQKTNIKVDGKTFPKFFIQVLQDVSVQNYDPIGFILGVGFYKYGFRAKDRDINNRMQKLIDLGSSFVREKIAAYKKMSPQQLKNLKNSSTKDILKQLYLMGNLSEKSTQDNYDVGEFIELFNSFMTAGIETTSTFSTNILIKLYQHPEALQKLLKQIDQYIIPGEKITFQILQKMKYLHSVAYETFRLQPPLSYIFLRQVTKNTTLGGVPIDKGTCLFNDLVVSRGYNEKYFDRPNDFIPERWDENLLNGMVIFPFSAGHRNCLGQHLGLIQAKIFTILFIKRFKYSIKDQIKYHFKFVVRAEKFKMQVEKRV